MKKIKLLLIFISILMLSHGLCLAATYYVDAINGDDGNAGTSGAPWKSMDKAKSIATYGDTVLIRDGNYGDFTDSRTTPGANWLIYKADTGHTPVFGQVEIGSGGNPSYIEVDGLTINGQFEAKGSHVTIKNSTVVGGSWGIAAIRGEKYEQSTYFTVDNCDVSYGRFGIYMGSTNCTITNNAVHYICEDGIRSGVSNATVTGNEVYDLNPNYHPDNKGNPGGWLDIHSDGISWYSTEAKHNITISGNTLHHNRTNGGGSLYIDPGGGPWTNIRIENNLMYAIDGNQFLLSSNGGSLYFNNNTIIETVEGVSGNKRLYGVAELHNNILNTLWTDGIPDSHSNNIFGSSVTGFTPDASSSILSEAEFKALFTDYDGSDFTLAEGSTAIGFADPAYALGYDILGMTRDSNPDAGCYEYGATVPWEGYEPDPEPEPDPKDPIGEPPVVEPEADVDPIVIEKTVLSARNNVIKAGSNSNAIIRCDLKEAGNLSVKVYDSKGKEIIILHDGDLAAGRHEFTWSGVDSGGSKVGSGIYMVSMRAGSYEKVKKIAVIK